MPWVAFREYFRSRDAKPVLQRSHFSEPEQVSRRLLPQVLRHTGGIEVAPQYLAQVLGASALKALNVGGQTLMAWGGWSCPRSASLYPEPNYEPGQPGPTLARMFDHKLMHR